MVSPCQTVFVVVVVVVVVVEVEVVVAGFQSGWLFFDDHDETAVENRVDGATPKGEYGNVMVLLPQIYHRDFSKLNCLQ